MNAIAVVRPKAPVATNGAAILQEIRTTYNPIYWLTWFFYCLAAWWNGPACFACGGTCVGHVNVDKITFHAEYAAEQERIRQDELAKQRRRKMSKREFLCMKEHWEDIKYCWSA